MKDAITPRWMLIKAATVYSSIGRQRLIRLAQDGVIKGFQDPDSGRGDWVFDRLSIDKYRENQMADQVAIEARAIELLKKAGIPTGR